MIINSPWDWGHNDMKLGTKHVIYQILFRKRIHMVAGMKVSYFAECVFYGPEHNAKGRPQHAEF